MKMPEVTARGEPVTPRPEWLICAPRDAASGLAGIAPLDLLWSRGMYCYRALPRTDLLERTPLYKQLCVYVVVRAPTGHTLVYRRRGKGEGEQRLAGKYSLGVGGHVEYRDLTTAAATAGDDGDFDNVPGNSFMLSRGALTLTLGAAATRELREELALDDQEIAVTGRLTFDGMIYSNADKVGEVHLGILATYWLPEQVSWARVRVSAGVETRWLLDEDLLAFESAAMEDWSRRIVELKREANLMQQPQATDAGLLAAGGVVC